MHTVRRILMLLIKVLIIGCLFYPISLFYPQLEWNFADSVQLFLGYEGNYEWWFLRPYIIIGLCSPFLLSIFDRRPWLTLCFSFFMYSLTKGFIYFGVHSIPLIFEQLFILSPAFFIGAGLAKWGILSIASKISPPLSKKIVQSAAWIILVLMVFYKIHFPSGLFDFVIAAIFVLCAIVIKDCLWKRVSRLLVVFGEEATSMWLIHTFIAIYYWSEFSYSFKYPIVIFVFVVLASFILSKLITILYNPIRTKLEYLFA